jgi:ketosteroid isomerase-like protein
MLARRAVLGMPALLMIGLPAAAQPDLAALTAQVTAAEQAFARSMAERDHAAFTGWLSEQAVFYGGQQVSRGKAAVASAWKAYFDGPKAPFSWAPDQVEVLADGTLAHSSGPVFDASGQRVARFNSVWRQEAAGVWRIVFDKGSPLSEAEREAARQAAKP